MNGPFQEVVSLRFFNPAQEISKEYQLHLCLVKTGVWFVAYPVAGRFWANQEGTIVPSQITSQIVACALLPKVNGTWWFQCAKEASAGDCTPSRGPAS